MQNPQTRKKAALGLLITLSLILFTTVLPAPASALSNSEWSYLCSGFFITNDGYIATAAHCVSKNPLTVEYRGNHYQALLVDVDGTHDVALYKIAAIETPQMEIGAPAREGDRVYILGFPMPDRMGYNLKIHGGSVSYNGTGNYDTTAFTCEGNSGGPVVNQKNQVIGVLTAAYGNQPCSPATYVVKIKYVEALAQRHGIKLYYNPTALDKSQGMIYNQDINSVILIYKAR